MIYKARDIHKWDTTIYVKGRWMPARPHNYESWWRRIANTWGVFIGKYDALDWENWNDTD